MIIDMEHQMDLSPDDGSRKAENERWLIDGKVIFITVRFLTREYSAKEMTYEEI